MFIDFQKAFDKVSRNLLLYKLSQIGINGPMYKAISSLYEHPRSRIILNEYHTEYFECPIGVKQGDCLSPTLFSIFINDLAVELKSANLGVKTDHENELWLVYYYMQMTLCCLLKMRLICRHLSL